MCETTLRKTPGSAVSRPRWGLLYTATLLQIAALGVVDVVPSPHPARFALCCLLALGVFATMALSIRANRPAFDLQDWCDCAGERMTIRVIECGVPQAEALPLEPAGIALALVEEDHEAAIR